MKNGVIVTTLLLALISSVSALYVCNDFQGVDCKFSGGSNTIKITSWRADDVPQPQVQEQVQVKGSAFVGFLIIGGIILGIIAFFVTGSILIIKRFGKKHEKS